MPFFLYIYFPVTIHTFKQSFTIVTFAEVHLHKFRIIRLNLSVISVVDPYSFFPDPNPDPEFDVGDQYGSGSISGSGSKSNTDPGL